MVVEIKVVITYKGRGKKYIHTYIHMCYFGGVVWVTMCLWCGVGDNVSVVWFGLGGSVGLELICVAWVVWCMWCVVVWSGLL